MAQAILYPEQSKQVVDVLVDNATAVSTVASLNASNNVNVDVNDDGQKKNRIQVSNTKKPLFFYLNLAKRYMKQHKDVELSALGMAIPTLVTIVEILKANGVAVEKKVLTSTVDSKDETKGRVVQKAKLEIFLERSSSQKPSADNATTVDAAAKTEGKPTADDPKPDTKSESAVLDSKN